jgi:DNA-binding MarR family transcriptional regulator
VADFVPEESLGYLVNRAARVMAQALARRLERHGVGIGQWAVLLFLYRSDGLTQAELARVVAIEPPTLVRTIDRMERDGLVTRRGDPRDGRVSRIHLTPRAIGLREALFAEARSVNREASSGFGTGEADALKAGLTTLVESLSKARSETTPG